MHCTASLARMYLGIVRMQRALDGASLSAPDAIAQRSRCERRLLGSQGLGAGGSEPELFVAILRGPTKNPAHGPRPILASLGLRHSHSHCLPSVPSRCSPHARIHFVSSLFVSFLLFPITQYIHARLRCPAAQRPPACFRHAARRRTCGQRDKIAKPSPGTVRARTVTLVCRASALRFATRRPTSPCPCGRLGGEAARPLE